MLNRIVKAVAILFTAYWIAFIFLDYWTHHPDVSEAIRLFRFGAPAMVLLVLGGAFSWAYQRFSRIRKSFNGLALFGLSTIILLILINAFFRVSFNDPLTVAENARFIGTMLGILLPIYMILCTCYVLGSAVIHITSISLPEGDLDLVKIGLGIMVVVLALFIFGFVGALNAGLLFPLFAIVLIAGWRYSWLFVQKTLLRTIETPKDLNVIGITSFYLLLILVSMNLVQVMRPIPLGYDAITLYVNLASLINDYGALVPGNQPYNWSLFISLGYLLFNKTAIVLTLSFMGTVLSLFGLYRLSRKWLNVNFALLVVFLFYTMPMVNWLSFRDVKIDLGLLFFSLVILLLFHNWLAPSGKVVKSKKKRGGSKKKSRKGQSGFQWPFLSEASQKIKAGFTKHTPAILRENQLVVLLGVFCGFAMGVKLSALLLFLALIAALWYVREGGFVALLGGTAIAVFFVLLARLDEQASLRQFHTTASMIQWAMFLIGGGIFTFLYIKNRKAFLSNIKLTLIASFFLVLVVSPWFVKNYSETKSLSVTALTNGKRANPSPTLQELDRVWRTTQNNGQ